MFESLERTRHGDSFRRWISLMFSIACHVVFIIFFVLVPLVFCNVLPEGTLLTFLIAPPPPPAPLPPVPPNPDDGARRTPAVPVSSSYEAPKLIPHGVAPPSDAPPPINLSGLQDIMGSGIPSGPIGPGSSGAGSLTSGVLLPPAPKLPPPPHPAVREPVPVGGMVQESKLIRRVDPIYPPIARTARVSGKVILEVTVDEDGNVTEVKVLQGHPLLSDEAVRAVRQWKYSPTLLNGEPVPVTATVTVIFSLVR